jgi:hypothetical protein
LLEPLAHREFKASKVYRVSLETLETQEPMVRLVLLEILVLKA